MEVLTFDEVMTDVKSSEHKRCSLMDKNGNTIVPFNSQKVKIDQRLAEIEARFNSRTTPDGIYQIHAKHYGQKAVPAIYYVCKGEMQKGLADISIENVETVETETIKTEVIGFTQDEYNELFRQNMQNEFLIERQQLEIDLLKSDISELIEAEPESKGFLSDDTQKFVTGLLDNAIPLIDKLLDQRDTKLKLRALELAQAHNPPPKQPAPNNNGQETAHQETKPHFENKEDAQDFEDEAHIYTMEHLKENNPEAYADLMNQMAEIHPKNP